MKLQGERKQKTLLDVVKEEMQKFGVTMEDVEDSVWICSKGCSRKTFMC